MFFGLLDEDRNYNVIWTWSFYSFKIEFDNILITVFRLPRQIMLTLILNLVFHNNWLKNSTGISIGNRSGWEEVWKVFRFIKKLIQRQASIFCTRAQKSRDSHRCELTSGVKSDGGETCRWSLFILDDIWGGNAENLPACWLICFVVFRYMVSKWLFAKWETVGFCGSLHRN